MSTCVVKTILEIGVKEMNATRSNLLTFLYIRSMKFFPFLSFSSILLALSLSGCKDTITQPDLSGDMVGYVLTFDEFGAVLDNHENVVVTAKGRFSAKTDRDGRFEFKNIPAGTYELDFDKPGFGSMKLFGIKHLGGTPTILEEDWTYGFRTAVFIFKMPTFQIVDLTIARDSIFAEIDFEQYIPGSLSIRCYFSNNPEFNIGDAEFSGSYYLKNKNGIFGANIGYETLKQFVRPPFEPGNTVYFKATVCNSVSESWFEGISFYGLNNYYDIFSNQTIYPNEGSESPEFSMVVTE